MFGPDCESTCSGPPIRVAGTVQPANAELLQSFKELRHDNVVRAVDVGFGNTKFVTGVSGSEISCGVILSIACSSARDPATLPAAEKRRTLAIPINGRFYEVGPEVELVGRIQLGGDFLEIRVHASLRSWPRSSRPHVRHQWRAFVMI